MRILFLTHSFNSLSQRLFVELAARGHEVTVEFDINDAVTAEAVLLARPDVIVAPFLKRAIPEAVWRHVPSFIVHPGPPGDRGPSALDWAILRAEREWGVTVLQAEAELDGGPVWASACFPMREAAKSSLYRNEVTGAAVGAVVLALERFASGSHAPERVTGEWRPLVRQADRAIDWQRDGTATVLRKIRSADGSPGVRDSIGGRVVHLYDAHPAAGLEGAPGAIIARSGLAIARATSDGAVWIGHLSSNSEAAGRQQSREPDGAHPFKLPAVRVLGDFVEGVREFVSGFAAAGQQADSLSHRERVGVRGYDIGHCPEKSSKHSTPSPCPSPHGRGDVGAMSVGYQDIGYDEADSVGTLHFPFYNGAMGVDACRRLLAAYRAAAARPTRVIVLMGGPDFWSNGMNLNLIEAAASAAGESWANINAIDDLAEAILRTTSHITIAALQGNAGAGGVFLARAADIVWLREGVILSPHYKDMGNLHGSEFWTYSLPLRAGETQARQIMSARLPMGAPEAVALGLAEAEFCPARDRFLAEVRTRAAQIASSGDFPARLAAKAAARAADEAAKPLSRYREEELAQMRLNFYGFDSSYHVARYNFVAKVPKSRTPVTIARHRDRRAAMQRTGS